MTVVQQLPVTIAEVDADLRLLEACLPYVTAPGALWVLLTRMDGLRALRRRLVAVEVAALQADWALSWPGTGAPEWPDQSGVGR